ncbi:MAG: NAD(P)H-quinone oxidoreductase, partial [Pseudomonadota bacterium]
MTPVLVIFYSVHGSTEALAREIARGIDSVDGAEAWLRTLPPVSDKTERTLPPIPEDGPPYVAREELA